MSSTAMRGGKGLSGRRPGRWLACLAMVVSMTAQAETGLEDLQVAARAMGFLKQPLSGEQRMAVVYEDGNTLSRQEAERISQLMGAGMRVGNLLLRPVPMPLHEMPEAAADFYFLTEHLSPEARSRLRLPAAGRPCVTTDMALVEAGRCQVGVQARPRVRILVNREAAQASNLSFAAVFRMMIVEI